MLCIHSWLIWQCIECFRWHETAGKSNVKWKHSFRDFGPISGEGRLAENCIYHCFSCLHSSALWTLNFTMYCELRNPKVDVILPNRRSESQGAIYPYEWCSYYELRASREGNEGRNRQNRLHLESRTPSWARMWNLKITVFISFSLRWVFAAVRAFL